MILNSVQTTAQFTVISVRKRRRIGESLQSFRPNPQGDRKERSHERLGATTEVYSHISNGFNIYAYEDCRGEIPAIFFNAILIRSKILPQPIIK